MMSWSSRVDRESPCHLRTMIYSTGQTKTTPDFISAFSITFINTTSALKTSNTGQCSFLSSVLQFPNYNQTISIRAVLQTNVLNLFKMIRHDSNPDLLMQICTKRPKKLSFHITFFFFSNMENK